MKKRLEMDDIRVGMYITVLNGKTEHKMFSTPNGPQMCFRRNDHHNGKVLEILEFDMPYIVVMVHEAYGSRNDILDLRYVEIMKLNKEYIKKFIPKFDINISKDHFWDNIDDDSLKNADTTIEEIFKDL